MLQERFRQDNRIIRMIRYSFAAKISNKRGINATQSGTYPKSFIHPVGGPGLHQFARNPPRCRPRALTRRRFWDRF